jgi:protein-tyrosine phosphatase
LGTNFVRAAQVVGQRSARTSELSRLIHLVLTHPAVMRVKPSLRRAWWRFKGRGTSNPPLPARVDSVLFVCLGNICRSPFAEWIARRLFAAAGHASIRCASAGIRPSQAARSPEPACHAASRFDVSLTAHTPQELTRDMMTGFDVVVVMEWSQLQELRATYPDLQNRIVLLSLLDPSAADAYERYNIADPFGHQPAAYDACYDRINRALGQWVSQVNEQSC